MSFFLHILLPKSILIGKVLFVYAKAMKWFTTNIKQYTLENTHFRNVLYTGHHLQLVLMTLTPGQEIGEEVHDDTDQFFRFETGKGTCMIDGNDYAVTDGSAIIVPAWARHTVKNTSADQELKFYTIYAPPHHKSGTVHITKEQAEHDDEEFDGKTTE